MCGQQDILHSKVRISHQHVPHTVGVFSLIVPYTPPSPAHVAMLIENYRLMEVTSCGLLLRRRGFWVNADQTGGGGKVDMVT